MEALSMFALDIIWAITDCITATGDPHKPYEGWRHRYLTSLLKFLLIFSLQGKFQNYSFQIPSLITISVLRTLRTGSNCSHNLRGESSEV